MQKDVQGKYNETGPRQWLSAQPGGSEAKADGEGGAEAQAEREAEVSTMDSTGMGGVGWGGSGHLGSLPCVSPLAGPRGPQWSL